jgi:hypothetical protein
MCSDCFMVHVSNGITNRLQCVAHKTAAWTVVTSANRETKVSAQILGPSNAYTLGIDHAERRISKLVL